MQILKSFLKVWKFFSLSLVRSQRYTLSTFLFYIELFYTVIVLLTTLNQLLFMCEFLYTDFIHPLYCIDSDIESSTSPPAVNYANKPNYDPSAIQELDGTAVQRHPSCLRVGHSDGNSNTRFNEDFLGALLQDNPLVREHTGLTPELDIARNPTPELEGREVNRPIVFETLETSSGTSATSMFVNTSINTVEEISIQKQGLKGRLWLGFQNIDNKLGHIYVKYHDLGKRKLYWNLWEKHRESSKYNSYAEFKSSWNPDNSIWRSITKEINSDIKAEVNDLLSRKRPFDSNIGNINRATINDYRHHSRHHGRRRTR